MVRLEQLFGAALALATSVEAGPVPSCHYGGRGKVIYFQTNLADNSVVAVPIGDDGLLSGGVFTPTGGAGASFVNPGTTEAVATDSLMSQDAVTLAGDYLFATNAGSNSLSMFAINSWDPTKLSLVGQPGVVQGDFPTTVTVSEMYQTACVATTGSTNGISCAKYSKEGLGEFDQLRPFNINQTSPPAGVTKSVGDTIFTLDSTKLITFVKGDPATDFAGYISVFPVSADGTVASTDMRYTPSGTGGLFSADPIEGTQDLFVTDDTFGTLTVSLASIDSPIVRTNISDQMATCWSRAWPAYSSGFITDPVVNHLVEIDLWSGAIIKDYFPPNSNPGMIDLSIDMMAHKVYVLAPGNSTAEAYVSVFDYASGRGSAVQVQNYGVAGTTNASHGMALWTGH